MGHRADKQFFEHKRPWSKRKDAILGYYLEPYLAKVRTLRKPVLLVDCFAGPGKFNDSEIGSPLIFCAKVQRTLRIPGPAIELLCIEDDPALFGMLRSYLAGFPFARACQGTFLDHVETICKAAKSHTLFMYIDPFVAADVKWDAIMSIARQTRAAGGSVEVLLNFNSPSFIRWALAATRRPVPEIIEAIEDPELADVQPQQTPEAEKLSGIVGGDWWRQLIAADRPFHDLILATAKQLEVSLRSQFEEVCWVAVKHRSHHLVPKYHMMFGSRHPDALELMNDAMILARGESNFEIDLFGSIALEDILLDAASAWIPRTELIRAVIRRAFCCYYRKEVRGHIESLLKRGKLISETGKARINDATRVMRQ